MTAKLHSNEVAIGRTGNLGERTAGHRAYNS